MTKEFIIQGLTETFNKMREFTKAASKLPLEERQEIHDRIMALQDDKEMVEIGKKFSEGIKYRNHE